MFSFDDIQYRRRELRLKKWLNWALGLFVILYAAFLVIYAIQEYTDPDDNSIVEKDGSVMNTIYKDTLLAFGVVRMALFAFSIAFTMNVYYLMKRLHQLEFERNKRNMRLIIASFWLNLIVMTVVYVSKFLPLVQAQRWFQVLWLINYPLQFPNIFLCFIMVKVKSSSDILQGLSKLDHLLKVSAFQVHKIKRVED